MVRTSASRCLPSAYRIDSDLVDTQPKSPQASERVELVDYVRFIRERWWVVALVTVILVGATVYYSLGQTPLYRTSAELIRQAPSYENTLLGLGSSSPQQDQQRIPGDARLLSAPDMAARVKDRLDSPRSGDELQAMIEVKAHPDVPVISVTSVGSDPEEITAVANGFVDQFVESRTEAMEASVATAQAILREQLATAPPDDGTGQYVAGLQARLGQLTALRDLIRGDYKVLQPALVPDRPFEPRPLRDGLLALIVGLAAGVALAFLLEYLDKRVKDELSLEREFALPVLASIPLARRRWTRRVTSRSASRVGFRKDNLALLEPYRMLRSNLQYVGSDRDLRMIMVTSPLPKQGKTTTTANLGLSLALAGRRVILIECDLRRPMLHEYLGLKNEIGLTNVLSGTAALSEALQPVELSDFFDSSNGNSPAAGIPRRNLLVLASGPLPPNPAELLGSDALVALLKRMAEDADYAIIDTPPALLASDALILAEHVDGVLISARLGQTTKEDAARMRTLMERSDAPTLGLVAGANKSTGRQKYYDYGYGY
jgi:capsular exopolysaccharide synthesis family protein